MVEEGSNEEGVKGTRSASTLREQEQDTTGSRTRRERLYEHLRKGKMATTGDDQV